MRSVLSVACVLMAGLAVADAKANDDHQHPPSPPLRAERPEWIWVAAERMSPQTVVLRRSFLPRGRVTEAQLRLAAEFTDCRVLIGGETVVVLDDYGPWLELDVIEFLRPGKNVVQLQCRGTDGPSAVAMSLTLTLSDGTRQVVLSNSSWQGDLVDGDASAASSARQPAVSFGSVSSKFWDTWSRGSRITAFDDYTQWKQASQGSEKADPATFALLPGFTIERLRTAGPDEGSWVSMAFDPQGRLTIAREDKGLLRFSFSSDGRLISDAEVINETLLECRGLLYAYDALYVNANNSKAMYRLRDTDEDDRFDDVLKLREFAGGVGHGRNDLALGPDGLIYGIHGDAVDVPLSKITDRTSPFRETRRDRPQREGHLVRTDRDGTDWELVASGLRNPFGIDFNSDGELFTYDADAEFDMGAPWYRPTRIVQLVSGADYGWRGRTGDWPPYQLDHADNALPVVDIGKGSPTAVKFGTNSSFPTAYREALFVLDWAYGRVLACHLSPRGAGYVCRAETFLRGRPLNVTDLDFGPDGAMYVITGGRKTESSLYRIRYQGQASSPDPKTVQQNAREEFSRHSRQRRRELERFHTGPGSSPEAVAACWSLLASPDPVIRHAARVTIEYQPVDRWKDQALNEPDRVTRIVALLALARADDSNLAKELLARLNDVLIAGLSAYDRLSLLEAYNLCLAESDSLDESLRQRTRSRLTSWMRHESDSPSMPPTGTGRSVLRTLCQLVIRLGGTNSVPEIVDRLDQANSQQERMDYLFMLRGQPAEAWTTADRRSFFGALQELERDAVGGDGMPGFLQQIRDEATATLTESERDELGVLLSPDADLEPDASTIERSLVQEWTMAELEELLAADGATPDLEQGRDLFSAVHCSRCHRLGKLGRFVGPDLTSVAGRFSRRDILTSILDPSRVVAEKYRNVQILTEDGHLLVGRVITGGDYRSPTLRIATDPLDTTKVTEVAKREIVSHQQSMVSPMPRGLLNTLTKTEIADLLAYIMAPPGN